MVLYGHESSDQKIFFDAGNSWSQPITLVSLCIPLTGKRSMAFVGFEGPNQMPAVLAPGSAVKFWASADDVEGDTITAGIGRHQQFRVMARDALGNEYLSNRISFKPLSK
jgi:hypothetical protein